MSILSIFTILHMTDNEYFLTGSRAMDNEELGYKISTADSDYDFVVSIHSRHHIIGYLQEKNIDIDFSCYNGGFKFKMDNKTYNIITCIPIEFMAWKDALTTLQNLIKSDAIYRKAIENKNVRYCVYEQLRGLYKSIITFNK